MLSIKHLYCYYYHTCECLDLHLTPLKKTEYLLNHRIIITLKRWWLMLKCLFLSHSLQTLCSPAHSPPPSIQTQSQYRSLQHSNSAAQSGLWKFPSSHSWISRIKIWKSKASGISVSPRPHAKIKTLIKVQRAQTPVWPPWADWGQPSVPGHLGQPAFGSVPDRRSLSPSTHLNPSTKAFNYFSVIKSL